MHEYVGPPHMRVGQKADFLNWGVMDFFPIYLAGSEHRVKILNMTLI
jgi:hypothetical protein